MWRAKLLLHSESQTHAKVHVKKAVFTEGSIDQPQNMMASFWAHAKPLPQGRRKSALLLLSNQ